MTPDSDSSATVDDEGRQLYKRYQVAETDEERHEMGKLDGCRHAEIYAVLEDK